MEEFRFVREEELEEAVKLADEVFLAPNQASMGEAFPTVFSASLGQSYGCYIDGRLVSFIGFVPSVIRIHAAELAVYSVGAVCTDPAYRGRGYAGKLLGLLAEHGRLSGASLMLVSGEGGLYEKFGCRKFGSVETFRLEAAAADQMLRSSRSAGYRYRTMKPTDWFDIRRLAHSRGVRFEQSLWDIAALLKAAPTARIGRLQPEIWVAENERGPIAFAVLAVPGDEPNESNHDEPSLIEWAGEPEAVLMLAACGVLAARCRMLNLTVEAHEEALLACLRPLELESKKEHNDGTALILDSAALLAQLGPLFGDERPAAYTESDGGVRLEWQGQVYRMTAAELLSLLFDAQPTEQLPALLKKASDAIVPIPFPKPNGLNFV
ncbi:GNAT family N-acetyltransferase [Paenibacillus taihuensis]|nr:GNAT family N-acetyltransferase [Paenibacillus taihuensis]